MTHETMSVNELRQQARHERDKGNVLFAGLTGLQIAGMSKAELLSRFAGQMCEPPIAGFVGADFGKDDQAAIAVFELSPAAPVPAKKKGNGNGNGNDLADILAAHLAGKITAGVDEDKVRAIVAETIKDRETALIEQIAAQVKPGVKTIEVFNVDTKKTENIGVQHKMFERLLQLASARMDSYLVGPAGSGKTTACHKVADALSLPFHFISVGLQTSKSDLVGYMDANGRYVSTHLRTAYENGGVFLLDEVDSGNANVLTVINAMLSNGLASFPDKMVERHKDFVFFAAGNTYGRGADRVYVGRNALDGATLDRFVTVDFDYDDDLEAALCPDAEWLDVVRRVRRAVFDLKEKVVVSPRASIKGAVLKKSFGYTHDDLKNMLIYRGVNHEVKARIEGRL